MRNRLLTITLIVTSMFIMTACGKDDKAKTDTNIIPENNVIIDNFDGIIDYEKHESYGVDYWIPQNSNSDYQQDSDDTGDVESEVDYTDESKYTESEYEDFVIDEEGRLVYTKVRDTEAGHTKRLPKEGFVASLYKDYSDPSNNPEDPMTYLISGEKYTASVDIEPSAEEWNALVNDITDNLDSFVGRTIRIRGHSSVYGSYERITMGDPEKGIVYTAEAFPQTDKFVVIVGTIEKGNNNTPFYIDTIEVSIVP